MTACLPAVVIVLDRLRRNFGLMSIDTGTMERGTVAGPRRATHRAAMADRSFVG